MHNRQPACRPALDPAASQAWSPGLALGGATALAAPFVLISTFTGMSWFDDEGALMAGFRSLTEGHRMYDEIYSLYGPLYNALYGFIYSVLRLPLTHTTGRLIAAAMWLSYTAAFALFCYRLTRSVSAMLASYGLVLLWLVELMDSPGHPEEICLLLLAAVLLLTCALEHAPSRTAAIGIGASVAALALVKINMGAYVGGGVLLVFLRASAPTLWTRIATPLVAAALLALPFAVEALLLDFAWVRLYIVFATLCIGTALFAVLLVPSPIFVRPVDWASAALAGGLTCLAVVGGMMLAGSSGFALLNAALLQNAHFIRNWYVPLDLDPWDIAAAVASAATAAGYFLSGSQPLLQVYRGPAVLALKWTFVVLGVFSVLSAQYLELPMLTPFCWLLMVPPPGDTQLHPVARRMAGLIGAILSLYPFPVAGHQIKIGGLLPVVFLPVLACDVMADLRLRGARELPALVSTFRIATIVITLGAAFTLRSALTYANSVPLGLPGTSLIRVSQAKADDLRWVTAELASCASSYSVPGMFSFAFWTGHALPTALNINDELAFIPPAQQTEIVRALSRQPDLCIVYNPRFLQGFDRGQIETDPPLLHYMQHDFEPVASRDGYVILKRRAPAPVVGD